VYTAFSGSHQDAIKKGMYAQQRSRSEQWDVPYLPIDPVDLGRTYEAIIRVNSQSGKGGVAYLMSAEHHLDLPRGLQVDFAQKVQAITDARGGELGTGELLEAFTQHYLGVDRPYELVSYTHESGAEGDRLVARMLVDGDEVELEGEGNGPIAALVHALEQRLGVEIDVREYHEHAMSKGEDATAAAYVEADVDNEAFWGVGIHPSIVTASLRAIVNAVNRAYALRAARDGALAAFD
jgi:2-isopropylmalate synthase